MGSYFHHQENQRSIEMKLLANENFPLQSILYLKSKGFDIISIGQEFSGIKDEEVINIANKQGRLILTFDRDYGTLIFQHGLKPLFGVIYLRFADYKPTEPGFWIENLLTTYQISFNMTLIVFDKNGIRQKRFD